MGFDTSVPISILNKGSYKFIYDLVVDLDGEFVPPLSTRIDLEQYSKKMDEYATVLAALSANGDLKGAIAFYCNDIQTKVAYITYLGVARFARGQGLGSALLDACIAKCAEVGMLRIDVKTWESNAPAIRLYQSRLFEVKGLESDRTGVNSIKMSHFFKKL